MKALKALVLAVCIVGAAAPAFAGVFVNDFPATKDTFVGRSGFNSSLNYGDKRFGRIGKDTQDGYIVDFDRPAMLAWINSTVQAAPNGAGITITDINQIGNGALTMNLNLTAYENAWDATSTPPPTLMGHYFWPAVRVGKGQAVWGEMTATFNNTTGLGNPWYDATGNALANIYRNKYMYMENTIANAVSESWGGPVVDSVDTYVYDVVRPWKLDDAVALAALTNPDVYAFQMLHDYQNKPWAVSNGGDDDFNGELYSRDHGSAEFHPTMSIMIDTTKIINQSGVAKTYLPGDCNKDGYVKFADYLILEQNFGKTGKTWAEGDFNGDGAVKFADYLLLEQNFGKKASWAVPEPATMSLLVLGGLAMLKRRSAK